MSFVVVVLVAIVITHYRCRSAHQISALPYSQYVGAVSMMKLLLLLLLRYCGIIITISRTRISFQIHPSMWNDPLRHDERRITDHELMRERGDATRILSVMAFAVVVVVVVAKNVTSLWGLAPRGMMDDE